MKANFTSTPSQRTRPLFLKCPAPSSAAQEFVGQQQQCERRAGVAKDAREMIAGRFENEGGVINKISQPLNRPVKIRWRRGDEEKMLENLGGELPAADERVAQDQSGIVPDKIISQGWRIDRENNEN